MLSLHLGDMGRVDVGGTWLEEGCCVLGRGACRKTVTQSWGCPCQPDVGRTVPLRPGAPAVVRRVGGLSSHPPSMPVCILPLLGVPDLEAD